MANQIDTDRLIQKLSENLSPVQPLESILKRTLIWFIPMTLGLLVISSFALGPGTEIKEAFNSVSFWVETVYLLLTAFACSWAAFSFSVPGESRPWMMKAPLFFTVGWLFFLLGQMMKEFHNGVPLNPSLSPACFVTILSTALPCGLLGIYFLRKGHNLNSKMSGYLGLTSAGLLSAFALQIHCPTSPAHHILLKHFLPTIVVGLLGFWVGQKLLRTKSPSTH